LQFERRSLLIRADANTRMGIGHVMRCLALAQAWKDTGGEVIFITACESADLLQRLSDEGFVTIQLDTPYPDPVDWEITPRVLRDHPGAWVVLDGYHFDEAYQQRVKEAGRRLLVIDDMGHLEHYCADVVLNQNFHAEQLDYSCEPYTQLLLGTQYVLLRREFLEWQGWKREIPEVVRRILVTLGGGDPDGVTFKVIRAINRLEFEDIEVRVVVGPSNLHRASLKEAVHHSPFNIKLLPSVENMPELMAWADVAVSAGGSTCWEMAFMGLPNVILVLAENQRGVAEGLDSCGVALNLGWRADISELDLAQALRMLMSNPARCKAMSETGRQMMDGPGTDRVVSVMDERVQAVSAADHLRVRRACFQDAELLWQWANDPTVRMSSFHPGSIPLGEHIEWYKKKLTSPNTRIWMLELDQVPVAQIRYDRLCTDTAEISFSIAADYRGKGLGTRALVLTSGMACRELGVKRLKGVVFSSNEASVRTFTKSGFECVGQEQVSDELCRIFVREWSESIGEVL